MSGIRALPRYIVEIRVSKVEKGSGVKPGDLFRMSCYGGRTDSRLARSGFGRARRYSRRRDRRSGSSSTEQKGKFEGIYPDWFDVPQAEGGLNRESHPTRRKG